MSRFIDSLKAQIVAYRHQKPERINAAIVLQFAMSGYWSSLNFMARSITTCLSSSTPTHSMPWEATMNRRKGLASLIQNAWLNAMRKRDWPEYLTLVHFPDYPLAFLEFNKPDFRKKLDSLTFRLSYMAKHRTKRYSNTERSFGCSQG